MQIANMKLVTHQFKLKLLKFESLLLMENYIRSVYCINQAMTLHFQIQFVTVSRSSITKHMIRNSLKNIGLIIKRLGKKMKCYLVLEEKMQKI